MPLSPSGGPGTWACRAPRPAGRSVRRQQLKGVDYDHAMLHGQEDRLRDAVVVVVAQRRLVAQLGALGQHSGSYQVLGGAEVADVRGYASDPAAEQPERPVVSVAQQGGGPGSGPLG